MRTDDDRANRAEPRNQIEEERDESHSEELSRLARADVDRASRR